VTSWCVTYTFCSFYKTVQVSLKDLHINKDRSSSNDFCHSCSRTIIGATHVLGAIDELEFEGMTPKLKELLADFNKEQQSKKSGRKKSDGKLKKSDKEGQTLEDTQTDQNEVDMGEEGVEQAEDEDLDLISLFLSYCGQCKKQSITLLKHLFYINFKYQSFIGWDDSRFSFFAIGMLSRNDNSGLLSLRHS